MFTGISAFPLTPFTDDQLDEAAYIGMIERLRETRVDSITAMGSTGSYAYLSLDERSRVIELAIEHAGDTPVFAGIGALRTSQVLAAARNAERAGAAGLLLAPVSYQPLTDHDVYELFVAVTAEVSVPVIVYDNPGTTRFSFSLELIERIAALPGIASIKIPGVPLDLDTARARVQAYRSAVPGHVTLGVAGDAFATTGLLAGCDAWYSVVGGTLPQIAQEVLRAARTGEVPRAEAASQRLAPLWELFAEFGSIRVIAAVAEQLGFARRSSLPLPIQGLDAAARARVAESLEQVALGGRIA